MTLHAVLLLSAGLFSVGLLGVVTRRNLLIVLMGIEIMLNAAGLAFAAFARFRPPAGDAAGQSAVLIAIAVAAAEAAVGLAIIIALYRLRRSVDPDAAAEMKG